MNSVYELRFGNTLFSRSNLEGALTEVFFLSLYTPGVVGIEGAAFHLAQVPEEALRKELNRTGELSIDFGGEAPLTVVKLSP